MFILALSTTAKTRTSRDALTDGWVKKIKFIYTRGKNEIMFPAGKWVKGDSY